MNTDPDVGPYALKASPSHSFGMADPAFQNQKRWVTLSLMTVLCSYWLVLFYGTHMSLPPGVLPGDSDKFVHCAGFAVLGALMIALRATRGPFYWASILGRWCILATYAAFDEWTQMFVNRTTDFHDWLADILGAAIGIILVTVAVKWRKIKKPGLPIN